MSDGTRITVEISEADFDPGAEIAALYTRSSGAVGAVATFIGLVRDRDGRESVQSLTLEHYPGMTEDSIKKIAMQAGERWPLLDVRVLHRVGTLGGGEQIVYVQVASSHREAAFAGAQFIMDYLKTDAVLWKREAKAEGGRWIEATALDRERREGWDTGE